MKKKCLFPFEFDTIFTSMKAEATEIVPGDNLHTKLREIILAVSEVPDRQYLLVDRGTAQANTEGSIPKDWKAIVSSAADEGWKALDNQADVGAFPAQWSSCSSSPNTNLHTDLQITRIHTDNAEHVSALSAALHSELRDEKATKACLSASIKQQERALEAIGEKHISAMKLCTQAHRLLQEKEETERAHKEEIAFLRNSQKTTETALQALEKEKLLLQDTIAALERASQGDAFGNTEQMNKKLQKLCVDHANEIARLRILFQNQSMVIASNQHKGSQKDESHIPRRISDELRVEGQKYVEKACELLNTASACRGEMHQQLDETLSVVESNVKKLLKAQHGNHESAALETKGISLARFHLNLPNIASSFEQSLLRSVQHLEEAIPKYDSAHQQLVGQFSNAAFRFIGEEEKITHIQNCSERLREERDEMQRNLFDLQKVHTSMISSNEALKKKLMMSEKEIADHKSVIRSLRKDMAKFQNVPLATTTIKRQRKPTGAVAQNTRSQGSQSTLLPHIQHAQGITQRGVPSLDIETTHKEPSNERNGVQCNKSVDLGSVNTYLTNMAVQGKPALQSAHSIDAEKSKLGEFSMLQAAPSMSSAFHGPSIHQNAGPKDETVTKPRYNEISSLTVEKKEPAKSKRRILTVPPTDTRYI